jgi:hypothetical protein
VSFKNIQQWLVEVDEFATNSAIPRMLVRKQASDQAEHTDPY